MDVSHIGTAFLLATVAVLLTCRVVALVGGKLGQPPVVGEMIAGVLLGPSVLGLFSPAAEAWLFPPQIRPVLYVVSQIGLVAFMFEVGYEFNVSGLRGLARNAGIVSAAGTVTPLLLGAGFGLLVHGKAGVFQPGVPLAVSVLFLGVTLAITAFPMLARIISEGGLSGTRMGSLALAAGALDDGVAWVLLALVLSLASGKPSVAALAAGGGLAFVVFTVTGGRRLLSLLLGRFSRDGSVLAIAVVLFAASWFTDSVGLYSVFGGFCVGVALPRVPAADQVVQAISPLTKIVFLPLFFAYSGLNTQLGVLTSPGLLAVAVGCILVAVIGKFGGCWAAARLAGEPGPVAFRVGALMNARGLMQLIAINVGLQAGIVSKPMFGMLVLVAVVTTVMANPCLRWLDRREWRRAGVRAADESGASDATGDEVPAASSER